MVRSYQDLELLEKAKNTKGFKGFPTGYWIYGVRSLSDIPDEFDDKFFLFKDDKFIMRYTGTTNPGLSILKGGFKDYNGKGAAVVVADQWYYDCWAPGKHKGKVPALVQVGQMEVGRDGDMDAKSEDEAGRSWGLFGINHHPATYKIVFGMIRKKILGWSAGCQVVNNDSEYWKMIELTKGQKRISYCLITEF